MNKITKKFIKTELENKSLYEIDVTSSVPKRFIRIAIADKKIPNYSVKKLIELMSKK